MTPLFPFSHQVSHPWQAYYDALAFQGYHAPSTEGINPDWPRFFVGPLDGDGHSDDVVRLPQMFWLRCRVVGEKRPSSSAQIMNWNQAWSQPSLSLPSFLYDAETVIPPTNVIRHAHYASVRLVLTGVGEAEMGNALRSRSVSLHQHRFDQLKIGTTGDAEIYVKTFLFQQDRIFQQRVTWSHQDHDIWQVTPLSDPMTLPLYAYAGVWDTAQSVGAIQQAFFQIDVDAAPQAKIRLTTLQSWRDKGVMPSGERAAVAGYHVRFMDLSASNEMESGLSTLADDFQEGRIVVSLEATPDHPPAVYRSFRFHDVSPGVVDVHFLPSWDARWA